MLYMGFLYMKLYNPETMVLYDTEKNNKKNTKKSVREWFLKLRKAC